MRLYFSVLCWFLGLACAFGQASSKPVLYYLKENLIKAPVDVPKGKQLVWEQVHYENGKLINRRSLFGRYTANPNEFIARLYLGEAIIVVSLDGKEVWKQTFVVRRSTNVLYKNCENEIFMEIDLPNARGLTYETDNGTIIPSAHVFYALAYPSTEGKCTITAKLQGNIVWQNTFEVRAYSPASSYTLYLGNAQGKEIDTSKPLPANTEAGIRIGLDSTFKQSIIVNYRVYGVTYTLSRGGKTLVMGRSADVSIPTPQSLGARSGDVMFIQVEGVQNVCPRCQIENLRLPSVSSFTFTVK
jgi:hypothetical protein